VSCFRILLCAFHNVQDLDPDRLSVGLQQLTIVEEPLQRAREHMLVAQG